MTPYVGGRYGSFAKDGGGTIPSYMHGTLDVMLSLDGDIKMVAHLAGETRVDPYLRGKMETNP